jgi:hypothetical protein
MICVFVLSGVTRQHMLREHDIMMKKRERKKERKINDRERKRETKKFKKKKRSTNLIDPFRIRKIPLC